jgi:hypothetical protein
MLVVLFSSSSFHIQSFEEKLSEEGIAKAFGGPLVFRK